ncbi:MAG: hypothetical protein ACRYFX_16985 [Janthinobacterium lividum]
MKQLLWGVLLLATPAAAQRPTAEAARPAGAFWPTNARTGVVAFTGPLRQPTAPALAQAEHLRAWLTSTCTTWSEVQTSADSAQLYRGQLAGVHEGVGLRFLVRLSRRASGWRYQLLLFDVRSPTGQPGLVHWLPLHRLLNDPDFRPDVADFQRQLQQALPGL